LNARIDATQFPGRLSKCSRNSLRGVHVFRLPLRNVGKWRCLKKRYRPAGVTDFAMLCSDAPSGVEFDVQTLSRVFRA
jgi:hypothetical protein